MSDIWVRVLTFKNANHLKKKISKELMSAEWHPKRWRNICIRENEKKEVEPIFNE